MDLFRALPVLRRHPLMHGTTTIGIGAIGGSIEQGETMRACLRREVREELGAGVRLELPKETFLIHDWQIVDRLQLPTSKKRPIPLMVILLPPQLGGPNTPDHLAIVAFAARLRGMPIGRDLFGLLRVEDEALSAFFARDQWPLAELMAHPGLTATFSSSPPDDVVLRPILTARAFQLATRANLV